MHPLAVGWAQVASSDPPLTVVARLSDQRPDVTSGFGGWNEVARPRRSPITSWVGKPALRMTLGLLLDKFAAGTSIERQISQLEQMGEPTGSNGNPPQLRVTATGGAVPYQDRTWVLDSLTFGDAEMNGRGDRTRQAVTLNLLEFVADLYVSPAKRRRAKAKQKAIKKGATSKRVHVKKAAKKKVATRPRAATRPAVFAAAATVDDEGEDLLSIAARELGDASRWVEIAALNGLRDPRATVVGQEIRLP